MELPITGVHLQQFFSPYQWMRSAILNFSALIRPLADFLELVSLKVEKRTKTSFGLVMMSTVGWESTETEIFNQCKCALENLVNLAHGNNTQRLCFYTDASDLV